MALKDFFRGIAKLFGGDSGVNGWIEIAGTNTLAASELTKSAWFFSCVKYKAESAAQVPLVIYDSSGKEVSVLQHANTLYTWRETVEKLIAWLDIKGRAYIYIPNGSSKDFYLLDSDLVIPVVDSTGVVGYKYYVGKGNTMTYSPDEIVMFFNFNPYVRLVGVSNLDVLKMSIDLSYNSDKVANDFFKRGAVIPGFLRTEQRLTRQDLEELQAIFESRYGGMANSWKIPILGKGLDFVKTALTPGDYEALKTEAITKNRISSVEGVPATLLNDTENLNYATASIQRAMFWENTLIPLLSKVEDRINEFLLPKIGYTNHTAHFDYSKVKALQEDFNQKVDAAYKLWQMSVPINVINEKLNLGLPELPWGWDWFGPLNITQLGTGYKPDKKRLGEMLERLKAHLEQKKKVVALADGESDTPIDDGITFDEKLGEIQWKEMIARTLPQEEKLVRVMMKYWRKQEKFVLEFVRQNYKAFKFPKSWNAELAKTLKPYLISFAQQAGDTTAARFGITFDLDATGVSKWVEARVRNTAEQINETTAADVAKQLSEAVANHESIRDMEGRIKNLFEETYKNRARTVARTEVISTNNIATMEAAKQAGMRSKTWFAALDERTRAWHAEAHGQTVGINESFIVGGEPMQHPGDISASASNVINCRCTMMYNRKAPPVNNETRPFSRKWNEKEILDYLAEKRGWKIPETGEEREKLEQRIYDAMYAYKDWGGKSTRDALKAVELDELQWIHFKTRSNFGLLERLVRELPRPPVGHKIYRGIYVDGKKAAKLFEKGSIVSVNGATSFSVKKEVALEFASGGLDTDVHTVLVIDSAPDSSFYIDGVKGLTHQREKEVVVTNARYVVKGTQRQVVTLRRSEPMEFLFVFLEPSP